MTLDQKRWVIGGLGLLFLLSLVAVQWLEVSRRRHESRRPPAPRRPRPGRVAPVRRLPHAGLARASSITGTDRRTPRRASACVDCHKAEAKDADVFSHYGAQIATIVTPRDCARCHPDRVGGVRREPSLQGRQHPRLARQLPGRDGRGLARGRSTRIRRRPGKAVQVVNGMAPANSGCQQCHGSLVAFQANDGGAGDHARPEAGRERASRPTSTRSAASSATRAASRCFSSTQLAQHRHRPHQPRRLARARARPATAATTSRRAAPASPRTAASATSAPTTRRRRSTTSRSTAWRSAT